MSERDGVVRALHGYPECPRNVASQGTDNAPTGNDFWCAARNSFDLGLFGHVGIVHEEPLKAAHRLPSLQSARRAIDFLSRKRSAPGEAACEGAGDNFGEHVHARLFAFPSGKQPPAEISGESNQTGGREPSGRTSFSENDENGTTHRLSRPSQRRQCGDAALRTLVTPGSLLRPLSAKTGEGMPRRHDRRQFTIENLPIFV